MRRSWLLGEPWLIGRFSQNRPAGHIHLRLCAAGDLLSAGVLQRSPLEEALAAFQAALCEACPDRKPWLTAFRPILSRAVSPRRGRGSQRPHPRSPDPYFRRRRAAIRAAQAPAANNASVAGSGTGCEPPPLPPGGGPGGGGQRDGMMQATCAFAGGTDKARRLPTAIMARLSFRIRSP